MTRKVRIKRIQQALGVTADGVIGVETLSALERALDLVEPAPAAEDAGTHGAPAGHRGLILSRTGIDTLIRFEISSPAYYNRALKAPSWPGGESGVTIGIGYDLGYQSKTQIKADWGPFLPDATVTHLASAAGIRGQDAKGAARALKQAGVRVSLEAATEVFSTVSLPEYARRTQKTYPGTAKLPADAQSALVSLVYNRGTKLTGARRREMLNIRAHVMAGDLEAIADEIVAMKRLWIGRNLDGLLKRRNTEAALVRGSDRVYDPAELVYV